DQGNGGTDDPKGAAMTRPGTGFPQWAAVDEGWGRKAVDFSALSEPANCREYVAVHHRLGVDAGDRLLDVACGSGLAIELARLRGASCCGVDASARLVSWATWPANPKEQNAHDGQLSPRTPGVPPRAGALR